MMTATCDFTLDGQRCGQAFDHIVHVAHFHTGYANSMIYHAFVVYPVITVSQHPRPRLGAWKAFQRLWAQYREHGRVR